MNGEPRKHFLTSFNFKELSKYVHITIHLNIFASQDEQDNRFELAEIFILLNKTNRILCFFNNN